MKTFFFIAFIFATNTWAKCRLPANEELVIGCTYKCGFDYRLRLTFAAMALGYRVRVVDLRNPGDLEIALRSVDGVLMPGGADINPDYYLSKVTPELREYLVANRHLASVTEESNLRDPFEYAFIRKYIDDPEFESLPLLGICRGMQMMTVGKGIPLYLDIKTELGIRNRRYLFDRISVEKGTDLDAVYRNDSFRAYKLHHQGLRVPYFLEHAENYPDVRVNSFSNNGLIAEGIEYLNRPAIGVQYHPEKSFTGTSAPIMRWLLTKSCEYKNARDAK